jgi:hypothetical protein
MSEYEGLYSGASARARVDLRAMQAPQARRTIEAPPVKPLRGVHYRAQEGQRDLSPEEIDRRFAAALKIIREQRRHARAS